MSVIGSLKKNLKAICEEEVLDDDVLQVIVDRFDDLFDGFDFPFYDENPAQKSIWIPYVEISSGEKFVAKIHCKRYLLEIKHGQMFVCGHDSLKPIKDVFCPESLSDMEVICID